MRSPQNGGFTAVKFIRGTPVVTDNRWIVPYSLHLLKVFQCHVNIEHCQTVASIKCLILCHVKVVDLITVEGLDPSDKSQNLSTGGISDIATDTGIGQF